MTIVEQRQFVLPQFAETLMELVGCVCEELKGTPGGEPCWCGLVPGLEVPWDYCGGECTEDRCGMGYVRVAGIATFTSFPVPDPTGGCRKPLMYQVDVGTLRCAPVGEHGEPVGAELSNETVIVQMADAWALHRAISCCGAKDLAIGGYVPVGPQGGCVGGYWSVFIGTS